jgi:hypothetical protein
MEYFTDIRLKPLAWKIVEDNKDYFLSLYDASDLSGYPNLHSKLGFVVGEMFSFAKNTFGLDNKKALEFFLLIQEKMELAKKVEDNQDIISKMVAEKLGEH